MSRPQGQLPYHVARLEAGVFRRAYRALLPRVVRCTIAAPQKLSFSVFSFSSERDGPEQVASLRSFIRYAGQPVDFTIVSDGSHSYASRDLLRRVHPCVRVVDWRGVLRPDLPSYVHDYAEIHPMGKKLAVELSLPIERPTIYADSDVLFFPAARDLASLASAGDGRGRYLLDCEAVYLDDRILPGACEVPEPLNAGFFILYEAPDWAAALDRLARLEARPNFHTEQTLMHLTMHAGGARPLDPLRYVVSVDDMFSYRDEHARRQIVLRHYTTPVRYKLWCNLGRSLLS